MDDSDGVAVDGVRWFIYGTSRNLQPICLKDGMRLYPKRLSGQSALVSPNHLICNECNTLTELPRPYDSEKKYVLDRIDAKKFKKMKFINLDDEALPIAEDSKKTKDGKYFVTAVLTESKVGQRLVVYAGERGRKEKVQIFVEPDIRRLAFDQTNTHPSEVFTKVEATFADNSKVTMVSKK